MFLNMGTQDRVYLLICSPQIEIIHETYDVHGLKYSNVKCRNLILWPMIDGLLVVDMVHVYDKFEM